MSARLGMAVLALALVAVGTTSCGSDEPARSSGSGESTVSAAATLGPADLGPIDVDPTGGTGAQICSRFTAAEISALAGSEVGEGQVAGPLDSACAWDFTTSGIVLVQAMTADFWSSFEQPDDPDHQPFDGLGNAAFVQPALVSGWTAAALFDDRLVLAEVSGPNATPELARRLLEGVVPRLVP